METKRPGYLMIKEAAARYSVSRAKLHRLIGLGRLRTVKDPRDERVKLLRTEELDEVFRFGREEASPMEYRTVATREELVPGRLTAELRAKMDELRWRISKGRKLPTDSVDIIREEREKRTRQVYRAAFGKELDEPDDEA